MSYALSLNKEYLPSAVYSILRPTWNFLYAKPLNKFMRSVASYKVLPQIIPVASL
jgi:hypothetical protein